MTTRFKQGNGDWVAYRSQFSNMLEVDCHHGSGRDSDLPYWERMAAVSEAALQTLKQAQAEGRNYVMFRHGSSTSRLGATTARSEIRGLMRSPAATPYIDRSASIQHETVFIARIKALKPEVTR